MRLSLVRLAVVAGSVAVIVSCDSAPASPKFGNGIAGGVTGTSPITPPNPSSPDTSVPFVRIDTPATTGQLVNVGDSILVVTRIIDDRQVSGLEIVGLKFSGSAVLGTLTQTVRYPSVFVPASGALPFRTGLQDTTLKRYLKAGTPIDSTIDSLVILAIGRDLAGNVDTARRRVDLVTGPAVTLTTPKNGDSVPQKVTILATANATHNSGIKDVTFHIFGDPTWPAQARLDTTFTFTVTGIQRNVTYSFITKPIDTLATVGGKITVQVSARDINNNPGSAPPVSVIVRAAGTTRPRVTQEVPVRLEIADSITITASGDGIDTVGFHITDQLGVLIKDTAVRLPLPHTSNARVTIGVNLPATNQGKSVRVYSYATDDNFIRGYSVATTTSATQSNPASAFTDSSLIVYGITYKLPRAGTVGDIVVDTIRSHVLVSNMDNNRLEVWQNQNKVFDTLGVAVGSLPWGLNVSINPDTLLVANSGGTNISRVFLGDRVTADPRTIQEDLARRIRTRTNFLWKSTEGFDNSGFVHYSGPTPVMQSDRPQYIGQIANGRIYFSTRPTTSAPEGSVRYLDPSQAFPDQRSIVFVKNLSSSITNVIAIDYDSVTVHQIVGAPDTITVWDHIPGTNQASFSVKAPVCNNSGVAIVGRTACTSAADPRFDARFPSGLEQGINAADAGMKTIATCTPNCSDGYLARNVDPVGITDTTFIALSADRNWVAIGEGNSSPGLLMLASAVPNFFSPLITQFDLTNQASERVFGLAIDSTGLTVAAHGAQSYFSAIDNPFHLRLQGVFAAAGSGGAGVAYHPRANGTTSPTDERLAFVAAGNKTVSAVDIAYFISRGQFQLKNQLYGPLRVTRAMAGDAAGVILKLYGIAPEGLVVIDLRAADILPVPLGAGATQSSGERATAPRFLFESQQDMIRFTTAGESHGQALVGVLEGIPAGLALLAADVDAQLARRQMGYGRGRRMQIEKDQVEFLSGVRAGETLGSPIAMLIPNRDWKNWREIMDPAPSASESAVPSEARDPRKRAVTRVRPGHADLTGLLKYDRDDARDILERASARETTMRVAISAVCRRFLDEFGVRIGSHLAELGRTSAKRPEPFPDDINGAADASPLRTLDAEAERRMIEQIDQVKAEGNTLGGVCEIVATGVCVGLGSHTAWDRKLDGRIGRSIMSIPAVKGVEIGMGFAAARATGAEVHDEIEPAPANVRTGGVRRRSNRAGGLEGGMTTGEPLVVKVAMKPISTLMRPLETVDVSTGKKAEATAERSDVTAVPAMGVIAEAMLAIVLAEAMLEKFGGDSMRETRRNYDGYLSQLENRLGERSK